MLSFLRRLTHSKIGVVVTFVALIVIALAFAAGGVSRLGGGGSSGMAPTSVATVGKVAIAESDFKSTIETELQNARQQQPSLDIAQFIDQGGLDGTLQRMINGIALDQFGRSQGMVISKRLVDGQIASLPGLQGPDGKFSPTIYKQVLAQQRITDQQIHDQIRQQLMAAQLTTPTVGASQTPDSLARPYAALLLEQRSGEIGFIPTQAMGAGAKPTDQELQTYYKQHIADYTIPQRRVIRYAVVSPDMVKDQAKPTAAEIAKAYQDQHDQFAAKEKRTLKQVIVADQNAASALAKKVRGGSSIEAAAKAAGLDASTLSDVTKSDYASQSSEDAAKAAFAAKSGDVVGPVQLPLGWAIIRVEKITQVPGKTLAEATPELTKQLTEQKTQQQLSKIHDAIDTSLDADATFDELIKDQKLQPQATAPVTSDGTNPDDPTSKPDPKLGQVLQAGFAAEQGDSPEMVPFGQDGGFAIVALEKIVPPTPRPLAKIHDKVAQDFTTDRARKAARKVAVDVVAAVNKGTSLSSALAQAKTSLRLPPAHPLTATRAQLAANPQGAPPPLALMFSMSPKNAKMLEAPNDAGWFVIYLDSIKPGDASGKDDVIKATSEGIGHMLGREYAQEFAEAVRRQVGVKKNASAIATVRRDLTGSASADDSQ